MLDISFIREHGDVVKKDLKRRQDTEKEKWVDEILSEDKEIRSLMQESQKLRHVRNEVTKEINQLQKAKKDISAKVKEAKDIPEKIKELEEKLAAFQEKLHYKLMRLPNILHDSVPYGKDDSENEEVRKEGKIPTFSFELKNHGELIEIYLMG